MAIRVLFEVGHTSKLKSKQTPDGFTHDWELYVRGTDKNDISHFVDKVVFNLHESFPKPKRVLKEAPYVLKESGYAGFLVPTEIHFKAREQPKVTFTYDLSLQNAGPPVHRSEIKKFTFNNPSEDFRRKLLKGGGMSAVNLSTDDKSRDSLDERSLAMSKPKPNSEEVAKKHKIRPEESKSQTFAKLFGPPITKTTSKVSPDGKSKSSPSTTASVGMPSKTSKSAEKPPSGSAIAKDKLEKIDKKDKHKHSPYKEKYDSKEIKKAEDKHERREEKKKDKSHSKERDRSHDKISKRPPSPKKPAPSPKRASPVRSLSAAGRSDTNGYKASAKTASDNLGLNNNAEKVSTSSSGKKSKKEKKSYDKERDREKNKDKERDRKDKAADDRSSNNSTPVATGAMSTNHALSGAQTNAAAKLQNAEIKSSIDYGKNKDKELNNSGGSKDIIKESNKKSNTDTNSNLGESKKASEKHDKDTEKRHKHKKKDKSKEKEKEKDHTSSKDKKRDKSLKKDDVKKTPQATSDMSAAASQKSNSTPLSALLHGISDDDTRDSVTESVSASVSERHESFAESSNSSVTEMVAKAASLSGSAALHQHPPPPSLAPEETRPDKKDRKNREKMKTEKDEKKRKRKSKDDVDASRKATPPPPTLHPEPPIKQMKKDDLILKNGDRSNSPHLSHLNANSGPPNPPPKGQHLIDDSKAFRTPNAANVPLPSTSSSSTSINTSQAVSSLDRPFTVDYISELRDLQQKIMTLQDSNDLQQVVELIAPTGRFEITSKSFDFDLCTLDRNTVQKLQDFFATTCS